MSIPQTVRNAKRSLVLETTPEGRIICGSRWMTMRIIGDTVEQVTQLAMLAWRNGGRLPEQGAR